MPRVPTLRRRALSPWFDWDPIDERMRRIMSGVPGWEVDTESFLWAPRVDFAEEEGRYVLTAELPGVKPEDMDVHVEGRVISIKGEKKSERKHEDERVQISERQYGSFERSFTLPSAADPEKVNADFHHGILRVEIDKRPETSGRKIQVQQK